MARRRSPGWVPDQHGAWAMLAAPLVLGTVLGGATWLHLLLAAAWFVAYFAFHATGLWLKSRRKARYRPPVLAYGAITAVVGGTLLVLDPQLLWWAPVFAPLLVISLWCSARRRDRSLLNDGATVLAACAMAVVAWRLGAFPYDAPAAAWAVAAVLWVYFFGTAFYVKTMIRERGNPTMLRLSIGWHAGAALAAGALAVVAGATGATWPGLPGATWGWLAAFFVVMTARAALVPHRWPRATPKQLGIGEIVATIGLAVALLA